MAAWALFLALFAALGGGCGSPAANHCPPTPSDPACPDAAPSFAQVVYPQVFQLSCVPCHSPGGQESNMPLTSYQQVAVRAGEIHNQVFLACAMPPPGAAQMLSDVQRQTLLDWLACGAPDN